MLFWPIFGRSSFSKVISFSSDAQSIIVPFVPSEGKKSIMVSPPPSCQEGGEEEFKVGLIGLIIASNEKIRRPICHRKKHR